MSSCKLKLDFMTSPINLAALSLCLGYIHTSHDTSDSPRSTLGRTPSALELAFEPTSDTTNAYESLQQVPDTMESTAQHFSDLSKVPTHRLPTVSHLCSGILDSLISRKRKKFEES